MDACKWKWKMKFRVKKLKGCFRLLEYNFRKKFNLEGDDGFYYHLQRELMRDLVKADPEREYLEEHGLLDEEPDEDMEPETETEPGLLRQLDFGWLIMTRMYVDETMYMLTEVKEYEDRICIKACKTVDMEATELELCLPPRGEVRFVDFELDGHSVRFDSTELTLSQR